MPETSHHATTRTRGRHRRPPLQATEHPILEVDGISARTSGGKVLLDDVSFAVQRGWLVAVVGPTGAGKTSLARALTGGLAYQGTVRLDGAALAGAGP
ncbi:MAG TPA: ATP-binding cassette domain-containing protein, partial [Acidimicrobiales bacterium]|nr:ATP-binding cassette domain-containing protein [Acidimicrobiales bacterium]